METLHEGFCILSLGMGQGWSPQFIGPVIRHNLISIPDQFIPILHVGMSEHRNPNIQQLLTVTDNVPYQIAETWLIPHVRTDPYIAYQT